MIRQYRYLSSGKSQDSIDGVLAGEKKHAPSYNPVFQFPQEPQQFPTHPSLPLKPDRIELKHPQMKFAPGGDLGNVVLPESPFPAPYLYDRGPGLQTPFLVDKPIQRQPRGFNGWRGNNGRGRGNTVATSQRKRFSRTKPASLDALEFEKREEDGKERSEEEDEEMRKRQAQGRQMSLPSYSHPSQRRGKRLFSMLAKQVPLVDKGDKDTKHRSIHRSRTVGSSPSRQPSIDPEKYRRCQTPDFSLDGGKSLKSAERRRGLRLRKCRTPDTILMGGSSRETAAKRESDSPENTELLNLSSPSSPGERLEGAREGEGDGAREGEGEGAGDEGGRGRKKDSLAATDTRRRSRRWGSRRDKSRKESSQAEGGNTRQRKTSSKAQTLPAHVTSSTPSYLARGTAAADNGNGVSSTTPEDPPPLLYFSLYFDIQRRALTLNLIKIVNLPQKPANQGSCDPFVMMFLMPNKQEVLQSVIKQRTLNPEFQQVFEFGGILANDLKNQVLVFRVFDHDRLVCVCRVCVCVCVCVCERERERE